MIWQIKDEDEVDPQLVFPFEAMYATYASHKLIETLCSLIKVLSEAEGLPSHGLPVQIRYEYSRKELAVLEKRLEKVGWKYDYEKEGFIALKDKKQQDLYTCYTH